MEEQLLVVDPMHIMCCTKYQCAYCTQKIGISLGRRVKLATTTADAMNVSHILYT